MTGRKNLFITLAASFCLLLCLATVAIAAGEPIPSEGGYIIDGTSEAAVSESDPTHAKAGTDFYIYITNPTVPVFPPVISPEPSEPIESEAPEPSEPGGEEGPDESPLPSFPPSDPSPGLPQTGDVGLDATMLMILALIFGSVYLLCNFYANKKHA